MSPTSPEPAVPPAKPWYQLSLTRQILLGLVLGCLLGWWMGEMPEGKKETCDTWLKVVRDVFLHLIKAMIAPLIFASVVQGIAGTGDMKKVGRIGLKALIYFEIVTTAALAVGLLAVNLVKPGAGVTMGAGSASGTATLARPLTSAET